ncbi:MAG: alpha-E domain-containing protein [Bacteroidia bacterium]|nr:alpha-E domain-containing protein [Bacteroidia bacterium]
MLARVANSLFWTGRYIERSEHLARYLKVQYFSILDAPMSQNKDFILKSILTMYGITFDPAKPVEEQEILSELGMNAANPNSILATVFAARENARSVRYTISTELWEVINQYYLFVKEYPVEFYKTRGLFDFTINIAKNCAMVRSYLDHTLIHDDIWIFIKLGMHLERAIQIIRILTSKLYDIEVVTENGQNLPLQQYQWTITLKVLEAFDMHRRVNKTSHTQTSTFEFLISNPLFPRSLAYNILRINALVSRLGFATGNDPLVVEAGKLSAYFQNLPLSDIQGNLRPFLYESLQKIYVLNDLIEKEYFHIGGEEVSSQTQSQG